MTPMSKLFANVGLEKLHPTGIVTWFGAIPDQDKRFSALQSLIYRMAQDDVIN